MDHMKLLYRDFVAIFLIFVFGLGLSQLAQHAISQHAYFYEIFECAVMCGSIAVPITLYRLFTGTNLGVDSKVTIKTMSALLLCILITYASFGFAAKNGYAFM